MLFIKSSVLALLAVSSVAAVDQHLRAVSIEPNVYHLLLLVAQ
jgi:hypothetical protein